MSDDRETTEVFDPFDPSNVGRVVWITSVESPEWYASAGIPLGRMNVLMGGESSEVITWVECDEATMHWACDAGYKARVILGDNDQMRYEVEAAGCSLVGLSGSISHMEEERLLWHHENLSGGRRLVDGPQAVTCQARVSEDPDPFPVDWSRAPAKAVCATYGPTGMVIFWEDLMRESRADDPDPTSIWVAEQDGTMRFNIDGYFPTGLPIKNFDCRGSLRLRPGTTPPQALAPTGERWNTTCGRCGAPAYQGLMVVECSGGCHG